MEKIHKTDWLQELQKPLSITPEDIVRDLYKFIKDFPIDIIPHMTEEELEARTRDRDIAGKPKNYTSIIGIKNGN